MTPDTHTALDAAKTLTGESLIGALNALDEKLPDGAYKAVKLGGRQFTDISPAYSLEAISEHFGPLGIGWGYEIEDEHESDHTTSNGNHYKGIVVRLKLWYVFLDGDQTRRVEWQAYGGNANAGSGADEHFSWQGALTNAIGKGWSQQGFQRTVYKGEDFALEGSASTASAPAAHGSSGTAENADEKRRRAVWGKAKALGWDNDTLCAWIAEKSDGRAEHPDQLGGKALTNLLDALQALIDEAEAAA